MKKLLPVLGLSLALSTISPAKVYSQKNVFNVAIGGNAWVTKTAGGGNAVSVYLMVDKPATVSVELQLSESVKAKKVKVSLGKQSYIRSLKGTPSERLSIGKFVIAEKGYTRFQIEGLDAPISLKSIDQLIVQSDQLSADQIHYVKDNEQNRYYWGRRGPSVHLGYKIPEGVKDVEYFYSEVNVPEGQDQIGSYFQANGFGQGYFGIQVNSPTERRILFSIWSPYNTDDPAFIPDSLKIKRLKKGDQVYTGEFGNEGSGGQSYLKYPWKAGHTYAFLTRAQPDKAANHTTYTSYFKPEGGEWILIASFQRPTIQTYLKGLYAFVENFDPNKGNLQRRANFGNQWVRDTDGKWTEVTEARFTGDDIANRAFRKDVAGGVEGKQFYLRMGGFFNDQTPLKTPLKRLASGKTAPVIDFNRLP